MPRFAYRALSGAGDLIAGELDAADAESVIARLHAQALLPIETGLTGNATAVAQIAVWRRPRQIPARALALFSQQLARLLKAGLPLDRALELLAGLAEDRWVSGVVRQTLDRVRDGASLADAMALQERAFPSTYVSMVRAGEAGSALQEVLARIATFLVRSEAIRQRVLSAMIYPGILTVVAAGSIALMLTVVLPQFEPLFQEAGATLPLMTKIVIAAGEIIRGNWSLLLASLAGLVLIGRWAMRQTAAAVARDRLVLAMPIVRDLVSKFEIGRFSRTLGVLLANGIPSPRALAICGATVSNRAIAAAVEEVATRFKEGESLSGSLARTGRFPELSTQLIRIGEETGRLEEMLAEIADIYDADVQQSLDRLLALLVPLITIGMGMAIAVIVGAVLTAMISVNDLAV